MQLASIDYNECKQRLFKGQLNLSIGSFNFSISSKFSSVAKNLYALYADFPLLDANAIVDFTIRVDKPAGIRSWFKPQVLFYLDEQSPFLPLPARQAFPLLEWGMNWCIAKHCHQYLMLHAAVLEKDNICVVLPAESGSGKSTLTTLLSLNGWRLLSDEMAMFDLSTQELHPLARPISLKNGSIPLTQSLANNSNQRIVLSDIVDDTNKGTISHLKPNEASVKQMTKPAKATHVIFPKYQANASTLANSLDQGLAMMQVIENSFNYNLLGEQGFDTLCDIMNQVDCYQFTYSNNNEALAFFNQLS